MKSKLLSNIAGLNIAGQIYPTHRVFLEEGEEEPESYKYDARIIFETAAVRENVLCFPNFSFTNLTYFLDGSRRTYQIAFIAYGEKFLPVVAGQVGAACCKRINKIVKKTKLDKGLYLLFPNTLETYDLEEIREFICANSPYEIIVDIYNYKDIQGKPPVEFAIAKLNAIMQEKELGIIQWLNGQNLLSTEQLLVLDGSLQFQSAHGINFDNIIGLSKTFKINLSGITKPKYRQVGVVVKDLEFGYRTPVFRVKDAPIGFWFMRIREKKGLSSPLDGIVKVEMHAQGADEVLDSSMVDNISKFLVLERNPACYGTEQRWPSLIYPIYLTEQLLKNSFMSELHFINLF